MFRENGSELQALYRQAIIAASGDRTSIEDPYLIVWRCRTSGRSFAFSIRVS